MPRIVIYGAGGFGREMRRYVLRDTERLGWDGPAFADDASDAPSKLAGLPVISSRDFRAEDRCVVAVQDGVIRRRMAGRCPGFHTLIAESAEVDDGLNIGEGAIICAQSIFTDASSIHIGRHFHSNLQSYVAHDCEIGDFVTFAPGVRCNGNVRIGNNAYLGTGSVLRNGAPGRPLVIGENSVIGMGAVVTKDVPAGATVIGNPARALERDLRQVA